MLNTNTTSSIHVLFRGDNAHDIEKSCVEKKQNTIDIIVLIVLLFHLFFLL